MQFYLPEITSPVCIVGSPTRVSTLLAITFYQSLVEGKTVGRMLLLHAGDAINLSPTEPQMRLQWASWGNPIDLIMPNFWLWLTARVFRAIRKPFWENNILVQRHYIMNSSCCGHKIQAQKYLLVHDVPEARLWGGENEQQTHRVYLGHQISFKVRF